MQKKFNKITKDNYRISIEENKNKINKNTLDIDKISRNIINIEKMLDNFQKNKGDNNLLNQKFEKMNKTISNIEKKIIHLEKDNSKSKKNEVITESSDKSKIDILNDVIQKLELTIKEKDNEINKLRKEKTTEVNKLIAENKSFRTNLEKKYNNLSELVNKINNKIVIQESNKNNMYDNRITFLIEQYLRAYQNPYEQYYKVPLVTSAN